MESEPRRGERKGRAAADQIQLYKLICRQVAKQKGMTATFLPKPVVGVNGSGMHTNVSISKDGKNLFWDPAGQEKLSAKGWEFVDRILTHGNDICLLLNSSVNSYRRLDPHFEAPNQIKASADRCPRLLGTFVKPQEVQFHHEVYNQFLWNQF